VALLLGQFRLCRGWPQYIRGAEAGSDWVSGLILLKDAFDGPPSGDRCTGAAPVELRANLLNLGLIPEFP
jgi:hypothetical protein